MTSALPTAADRLFACAAFLLKLAQLDYLHGMGGGRLGGVHVVAGRCGGGVGGRVEAARDAAHGGVQRPDGARGGAARAAMACRPAAHAPA